MHPTRPVARDFARLALACAAFTAMTAPVLAQSPAASIAAPNATAPTVSTTIAPVPPPRPRAAIRPSAAAGITRDQIEAAQYLGGDLPAGQSALTAKTQILLDRSGISPGVVDGWRGGMSESAIKAFQRRANLPMTGRMDHAVWELLQGFAASPLTADYTILAEDGMGLVDNIPADYAQKAAMTSQGYTSILESLAERFHMDEKFLAQLNPGASFAPGETIHVALPAKPIRARVTRIIVDKENRRVAAYTANGTLVADYPATVGSADTPSPHGRHVVDAVALNPTYTYNPHRNFRQGENDRVLTIPPGPNGPVGNVWIDLSEPTYGIHGTATPSRLFVSQSHGCVRLTNWDAWELAHMVQSKVTTVEFLEPGVSIADLAGASVTAAAAQAAVTTTLMATRPPARGERLPPLAATAPSEPAPQGTTGPASGTPSLAVPPLAQAAATAAALSVVLPTPVAQIPSPAPQAQPLGAGTPAADAGIYEPEYPSDSDPAQSGVPPMQGLAPLAPTQDATP